MSLTTPILLLLTSIFSPLQDTVVKCTILGDTTAAERKAIESDVSYTYEKYKHAFGYELKVTTLIDLRDKKSRPSDAVIYMSWMTDSQLRAKIKGQVPDEQLDDAVDFVRENRALTHELGHDLLFYYANSKLSSISVNLPDFGRYGHKNLPDWIDESFPVFCEDSNLLKSRLRFAQNNLDRNIPFSRFFMMKHPNSDDKEEENNSTKPAGKDSRESVTSFYAQAGAFYLYLEAKAGPLTFKKIVDKTLESKSMSEILPTISGLPHTVEALENDWKNWMKIQDFS